MAITTRSSTRVKPRRLGVDLPREGQRPDSRRGERDSIGRDLICFISLDNATATFGRLLRGASRAVNWSGERIAGRQTLVRTTLGIVAIRGKPGHATKMKRSNRRKGAEGI